MGQIDVVMRHNNANINANMQTLLNKYGMNATAAVVFSVTVAANDEDRQDAMRELIKGDPNVLSAASVN